MITIQSGKLTIPEDERFVGFAGDNTSGQKQFVIVNRVVPGSVYTLYLRFDNGEVSSIVLPSRDEDGDSVLTWNVLREHLKRPGIVTAQLKMTDGSGNIIHTTRDYFLVGYPAESEDGSDDPDPDDIARLEESISAVAARLPYVVSDRVYITDSGGDIRVARFSEVYSKSDIDDMLGDVEALLATV